MESLTLSCTVCMCEVKVDLGVGDMEPQMYVVPLFILEECLHALCLGCCKKIQEGRRRAIACPTCRTSSEKFYSYFYSAGTMVKFTITLNLAESYYSVDDILQHMYNRYKFCVIDSKPPSKDPSLKNKTPPKNKKPKDDIFAQLLGPLINKNQNTIAISGSLTVNAPSTSTATPSTSTATPSTSGSNITDNDFDAQLKAAMELSRIQYEHEKINKEINESLDIQAKIEINKEIYKNLTELIALKNKDIADIKSDIEKLNIKKSVLLNSIADIQFKLDRDAALKKQTEENGIVEDHIDAIKKTDPEIAQMAIDVRNKITAKKKLMSFWYLRKRFGCYCKTYEHVPGCKNRSEPLQVTWLKKRKGLTSCTENGNSKKQKL
ncbi:CG30 [Spodoptera cosmioides nucleopolyhedrovirus]|uniref:CG30 n=1 Tax=Spodoptera cosmioides nucleopolyhedrovirus TaxID=2605774 RepID=A0A6B7KGN0_9ABAC|nr:CG30 [Spodoptera cosmioides nucleopolyhedrovirus]